nr:hypothetical protein [Tanacetum cinerariifolium]
MMKENKVNKTAGPIEANNSAGTQANINFEMEAEHAPEYFVLPLWSSYNSTVKSSKAKTRDKKLNGDVGAARAGSTNYVNTVSIPVNTASTPVNTASTPVNTASPSRYANIYEVPSDEIFTSASYDDEEVWLDLRSCCWDEGSFKCWLITTPQMVINSPCLANKKELVIPGQTTTGKELSNLLMAGSFIKTTLPTKLVYTIDHQSPAVWEVTLLFANMLVQAREEVGIFQADAHPIPIPTEPSTSKHQKRHKPKRKHTQEPKVPPTKSPAEHALPSPSYDPLPSGEDSFKLKELIDLCTNLSNKVLYLESEVIDIKSTYQVMIEKLESKVERLKEENRVLKELKSVHSTVDANEPVMGKEKSSKHKRKIADIDADVEINLEKAQAKAYNLDLDH